MVKILDIRLRQVPIAVVGLGYVGLPLAAVIGFDISRRKIRELREGVDATGELDAAALAGTAVDYTLDSARLRKARVVIDVKGVLQPAEVEAAGLLYWAL